MDKVGLQNSGLGRWIWQFRKKVEKLLDAPVQITIFGSYSRGEETKGSGTDLLVVAPKLDKKTLDVLLDVAWEVGYEAGIVLSVIPVAVDEMAKLAESPFLRAVQREGIRL